MTRRRNVVLDAMVVGVLGLTACSASRRASTADGSAGVCCPIAEGASCAPGIPGVPAGGWAATESECASHLARGFGDYTHWEPSVDEHGCPVLVEMPGCCDCIAADAGLPPPDASTDVCGGLPPAACLAVRCVPVFDDACCSECAPGPCADCRRPVFIGCASPASSPCRRDACGTAPAWACGSAVPDCTGANVVAEDACDRPGCVPAYPSSDADLDPPGVLCVPITAQSCIARCRRLPPTCPTGTVPEGDGSCYTDRCIPAFVCG